jgi:hypothetical protein
VAVREVGQDLLTDGLADALIACVDRGAGGGVRRGGGGALEERRGEVRVRRGVRRETKIQHINHPARNTQRCEKHVSLTSHTNSLRRRVA